jgi:hypothetical protein
MEVYLHAFPTSFKIKKGYQRQALFYLTPGKAINRGRMGGSVSPEPPGVLKKTKKYIAHNANRTSICQSFIPWPRVRYGSLQYYINFKI